MSINRVLLDNPYPLPNTEDVFATLGSGTVFSKIDLSNAYQQMELTADNQQYLTVNTHKGLYAYQRLTYRLSHKLLGNFSATFEIFGNFLEFWQLLEFSAPLGFLRFFEVTFFTF